MIKATRNRWPDHYLMNDDPSRVASERVLQDDVVAETMSIEFAATAKRVPVVRGCPIDIITLISDVATL